jgi:hypothetical protein
MAAPLHWIEASEPLLELAESIKARDALSVADLSQEWLP